MKHGVLDSIETDKISSFVSYEDRMFGEFINLYRDVNGEVSAGKAKKRFEWQFRDNPAGGLEYIKLLPYGGRVIANIGTMPTISMINKELGKIYFACDVMVLPNYQKLGLGLILLRKFMDTFTPIVFFGVKKDFASILERLRFAELADLPYLVKIFDAEKFASARKAGKPVLKVQKKKHSCKKVACKVRKVEKFGNEFTDFFNKIKEFYKFIAVRDKEYLNWKYASHPYHSYMIATSQDSRGGLTGYLVLRVTDANNCCFGTIAEIVTAPGDKNTIDFLLSEANLYFAKKNVDFIETVVSNYDYRSRLEKAGFTDIGTKPRLFFFDKKNRLTKNIDDWFITKGDSDVDLI